MFEPILYSSILCRDSDLPLIVAIDLQPMAPIEGVIQVQGDITNARTAETVCTFFVVHLFLYLSNYKHMMVCVNVYLFLEL